MDEAVDWTDEETEEELADEALGRADMQLWVTGVDEREFTGGADLDWLLLMDD